MARLPKQPKVAFTGRMRRWCVRENLHDTCLSIGIYLQVATRSTLCYEACPRGGVKLQPARHILGHRPFFLPV